MAEKLEDLNLPNVTVQKIIKEAIPENVGIGKDARSALSRAASIFVLYITSQATKEAQKSSRKTLLGQDVLTALQELEFDEFLEPLQEIFNEFKNARVKRRSSKKSLENGADKDMDVEEVVEDEETPEVIQ